MLAVEQTVTDLVARAFGGDGYSVPPRDAAHVRKCPRYPPGSWENPGVRLAY
jgi:hypothetical protein